MPPQNEMVNAMSLTPKQRQQLKAKAHKLKPVVMIGNQGLTPAVTKEIQRALNDHELIKIKVASADRDERRTMLSDIAAAEQAELVQVIGSIGVFYKKNESNE